MRPAACDVAVTITELIAMDGKTVQKRLEELGEAKTVICPFVPAGAPVGGIGLTSTSLQECNLKDDNRKGVKAFKLSVIPKAFVLSDSGAGSIIGACDDIAGRGRKR